MKLKLTHNFMVQAETARVLSAKLANALIATGKVKTYVPPDCFLWSGTPKELHAFIAKFEKANEQLYADQP